MSDRDRRVRLVHVTTVPQTLDVFRGQAPFLRENGFDVIGVSSPGPLLDSFAAREHVPVVAVPMRRNISPIADAISLIKLIRTLRRLRPDIVHAHSPKAGLLGTIAARAVGAKAFLSIIGLVQMTRTGFSRTLLDLATKLSCALAHRVWVNSFSLRDFVVEEKLSAASKTIVIGSGSANGVDVARFTPPTAEQRASSRARSGVSENAFAIGFAGRMTRDKGVAELVQAFLMLRERHSDVELVIAGEYEDQDPVSNEIKQAIATTPGIHFLGWGTDMPSLYAGLDLLVLPSYREGFPMAVLEAAAMGIAAVTTDAAGCIDSVDDGVTGAIVPVGDATALANAIDRYYADREMLARHGASARTRVLEKYTAEVIWRELVAEYRKLLAESERESPS